MKESNERPGIETEQTPEQIKAILETALSEGRHVDLLIGNSVGGEKLAADLIVEEFEGENLIMTYIADDGDVGELIPLQLARMKKATII